MSLTETIKAGVIEYGPLAIPGVVGLRVYYALASAAWSRSAETWAEIKDLALMLSAACELMRWMPTVLPSASYFYAHSNKALGMAILQYCVGTVFMGIATWQIEKLGNRKRGGGGEEEEKRTQRLEQIIAQRAGQPTKG